MAVPLIDKKVTGARVAQGLSATCCELNTAVLRRGQTRASTGRRAAR